MKTLVFHQRKMKLLSYLILLLSITTGCSNTSITTENMGKEKKSTWFEGSNEINCDVQKVRSSLENPGEYFKGVVSLMPGMKEVELIDQGADFVNIKTNEGLMKRTNISVSIEDERVVVEFDEEYQAGKTITTNSHFMNEYIKNDSAVNYRTVISNVKAPGFMGFFYRSFGSSNIGKSFLEANKKYLEK